jgi:hypothetical protein
MAGPHQNEPEGIVPTTEAAVRHLHIRKQCPDETVGRTGFLRLETSGVLQAHRRERTFLGHANLWTMAEAYLESLERKESEQHTAQMMDEQIGQAVHQYTQQGPSSSKLILKSPEQNEILGYILRILISKQYFMTVEYIRSADNPADPPSRGIFIDNAKKTTFRGFPKGYSGIVNGIE